MRRNNEANVQKNKDERLFKGRLGRAAGALALSSVIVTSGIVGASLFKTEQAKLPILPKKDGPVVTGKGDGSVLFNVQNGLPEIITVATNGGKAVVRLTVTYGKERTTDPLKLGNNGLGRVELPNGPDNELSGYLPGEVKVQYPGEKWEVAATGGVKIAHERQKE